MVGDWDGNGTYTAGGVRGKTWYLRNSNNSGAANVTFAYGSASDIVVAGDWDGNRTTTPGVIRGAARYLRNSNTSGVANLTHIGRAADRHLVGDWDGDGTVTAGVVRDGTWYLRNAHSSGSADMSFPYGDPGDLALATPRRSPATVVAGRSRPLAPATT